MGKYLLKFLSIINFRLPYFQGKHRIIKILSKGLFRKRSRIIGHPFKTIHGFHFDPDSSHCLNQIIWNCEPFTAKVIAQLAPLADQFIDVGSNLGFYTLFAKSTNPALSVTAFEPEQKMFNKLCRNIELNSYSSVFSYNLALGERKSKKYLHTYLTGNDGMHTLAPRELWGQTSTQLVAVESIDKFIGNSKRHDFKYLVKIDVEGVEDDVLRGGLELIRRNPVMIIELNQGMRGSSSKEELNYFSEEEKRFSLNSKMQSPLIELMDSGYKIFWLDERESLVMVNSIDFLPHHEELGENCGANYLFTPKDFSLPNKLKRLIR